MKIRNLTPHTINLLVGDKFVEYPPDGPAPRVSEHHVEIEGDFPFKAVKVEYGDIVDLPDPEEGTILVVSKMCADARPKRRDLWYPAKLLRDDKGVITGCEALACLAY